MRHPGIIPPPVPLYPKEAYYIYEHQAECAMLIIRFIEGCLRSAVLASDEFFKDFLSKEQSAFRKSEVYTNK